MVAGEMDMTNGDWRKLILLALCAVLLSTCAEANDCPSDVTSCCACITIPGCSWYHDPSQPTPICAANPDLSQIYNTTHRQNYITPNRLQHLYVPRSKNRTIHPGRRRLIKPQMAQLTLALGARYEFRFHVLSVSTRLQLRIRRPRQSPDVSVIKTDDASCSEGFARLDDTQPQHGRRGSARQGRARGRGRSARRQLRYQCISAAPGLVHEFRLLIDMYSCLSSTAIIKVDLGAGSKRLKLVVKSDCQCPQETSDIELPAPTRVGAGTQASECNNSSCQCTGANPEAFPCENQQCQANPDSPTCHGRGLCLCGNCMCDLVLGSSLGYRYHGQTCECNDATCPVHNGQICGGPNRGMCICGTCQCNSEFTGDACHLTMSTALCSSPDSPDTLCSGHGLCTNGQCQCEPGFYGRTCECHDASCPDHNGRVCGGPTRGVCMCGTCQCQQGFTGDACQETTSTNLCHSPNSSHALCNGRGLCRNGHCQCEPGFYGQTCECNDASCPYHNGQVCGAPTRGRCVCGTCQCQQEFTGDACQVSTSTAVCSSPDSPDTLCSGNGLCRNGHCQCEPGFYGQTCECNDASCPYHYSQFCGGPTRGRCVCGTCRCQPEFTGDACQVSTSTDLCHPPGSPNSLCSGHGLCTYCRCRCEPGYAGQYCQECLTCPTTCNIYRSCVQCRFNSSDSETCSQCLTNDQVQYVPTDNLGDTGHQCVFLASDNCLYTFTYTRDQLTGAVTVRYNTRIECPDPGRHTRHHPRA